MKVAIWANSPSPHQVDFYAALRRHAISLRVLYSGHLRQSRRELGWSESHLLPEGEMILQPNVDLFRDLVDWRERVHIIPGYSRREHRQLVRQLSAARVPWVHWSEPSQPAWRSYLTWTLKRWYATKVNRYALGAFAVGDMAARDFRRWGIRPEKIAHLYYAINGPQTGTPLDQKTAAFVEDRLAFVFVGSLCHRKGVDVLLRAFSRVASNHDEVALVIVGEGPQSAESRSLAKMLRLEDRVLFRGLVPHAEISSVLQSGHVVVLPSRFDGWGVALNEAAAAGLALIATDRVGAAHHLIEPGENGFRVRAGSCYALAAAMNEYADKPLLAKTHGARSLERFQAFTPEASVARFVAAIRGWRRSGVSSTIELNKVPV